MDEEVGSFQSAVDCYFRTLMLVIRRFCMVVERVFHMS